MSDKKTYLDEAIFVVSDGQFETMQNFIESLVFMLMVNE